MTPLEDGDLVEIWHHASNRWVRARLRRRCASLGAPGYWTEIQGPLPAGTASAVWRSLDSMRRIGSRLTLDQERCERRSKLLEAAETR